MKKLYVIAFIILACLALISFGSKKTANQYISFYDKQLSAFSARQQKLLNFIEKNELETEADRIEALTMPALNVGDILGRLKAVRSGQL